MRVDPHLVALAKNELSCWGSSDYKREIAVGCSICAFLIGGFLGAGAVWLYTGSRTPRPGEKVKVVKDNGSYRTGPWGGVGQHGDFRVGKHWYDPEDLRIVGPEIHKGNKTYVDLNYGWIDPITLAKLQKAHNRDGYRKRKGKRK